MNVHYAKVQKSLIVEQFQGNYLKYRIRIDTIYIVSRSLEKGGTNSTGWKKLTNVKQNVTRPASENLNDLEIFQI